MKRKDLLRIIICLVVLLIVVYVADQFSFTYIVNNANAESFGMSISGLLLTIGNLFLLYKNYNLSKTNIEYNKKKQMFDDNVDQYYDYLRFLLQVVSKYRWNYLSSSEEAVLGEIIIEPTVDELLEIHSFFLDGNDDLKFTGLSSVDICYLKKYISRHKNNLFMLKFYKLFNEAESKVPGAEFYFEENESTIELVNGRQYKISLKGRRETIDYEFQDVNNQNYIDLEKKILAYAKSEIEKVQKLVNQYNEIEIDLLK